MLTVWNDLSLVVNFVLNCLSSIASLVMSTFLVVTVGLWILSLVVKLFKRFI